MTPLPPTWQKPLKNRRNPILPGDPLHYSPKPLPSAAFPFHQTAYANACRFTLASYTIQMGGLRRASLR
jgi:hypothetical protein